MKIHIRASQIVVVIIFCCLTVLAQVNNAVNKPQYGQLSDAKQQPSSNQRELDPLLKSFDRTVTNLPSNFIGHDPRALYNALIRKRESETKGEFETTAEFRLRLQKEKDAPLIGGITPESILAFNYDGVSSVYNADRELLQVSVSLEENLKEHDYPFLTRYAMYRNGLYVYDSQAALLLDPPSFGNDLCFKVNTQKAPVLNANYIQTLYIAFNNFLGKVHIFNANIKMDVPTAKQAKQHIRMLLVCKLVQPYTTNFSINIRNPDVTITHQYLRVTPIEFWFYDIKTGQIYDKTIL